MATGAGADRVQEGMRRSFGKPVGKAVRIKAGQAILSLFVFEKCLSEAKRALTLARQKLPGATRVNIVKLKEVIETPEAASEENGVENNPK